MAMPQPRSTVDRHGRPRKEALWRVVETNGTWRVVPRGATVLATNGFGSGRSWPVEMLLNRVARSSTSSSTNTNTGAMELLARYEPLRFGRKDGLPQPAFDLRPRPPSPLLPASPQPPPSTTSSAKPEALPAFTPPLWFLYLCRSLEAEASAAHHFQPDSLPQAPTTPTRRDANSPSILAHPQKHRKHFSSITPRKSRPAIEAPPKITIE